MVLGLVIKCIPTPTLELEPDIVFQQDSANERHDEIYIYDIHVTSNDGDISRP
jgi:hypothetical protein